MNRDITIALLRQHLPELKLRYGVLRLALFGSLAREQAQPASDADILVACGWPADSRRYFGVQF